MVNKKYYIYIILLLLVIGTRVAYLDINESNYYWDEVIFLHLADNINEGSYYSELGEHFRPPLFPFILSFFGEDLAHYLIFLLVLANLFLVYLLGKEIFDKKTGLIAAILFSAMPLYFFYSFKLLTEPLALCWILLAFYFLYQYEKKKTSYFLFISSFFLGLSVLTRYLSLILVFSFVIYAIFKKWWNKDLLLSIIIFSATISPLFVLGWINYGNPLGMFLTNLLGNTTPNGTIFYYFINFFSILGFFIPFCFILGLKVKEKKLPILIFMIIYFFALMVLSQRYERFFLLLFPFFAIIAAKGVTKLNKWKLGTVVLIIWLIFNIYTGISLIEEDKDNTFFLIGTAKSLNLDGPIMANSPVYFLYFSDMDSLDFPKDIQNTDSIDYFIVDNYHPRYDTNYSFYVNYLKQNKEILYGLKWEHREIIVYGTENNN